LAAQWVSFCRNSRYHLPGQETTEEMSMFARLVTLWRLEPCLSKGGSGGVRQCLYDVTTSLYDGFKLRDGSVIGITGENMRGDRSD
jgi:hypothetical protein